jgi:ribonuclease III family protein
MNPLLPLPHPRALAHLGDAVYELWVRETAITFEGSNHDLHRYTIKRVNAEIQSKLLEVLLPSLPEDVQALVKRAQNMPVPSSRRSNQSIYRKATGFEALIGYWYLQEFDTLEAKKKQVLQLLEQIVNSSSP